MEISELFPKSGKLVIKEFNKEYELRPLNLRDEIWLKDEYGEGLAQIFNVDNIDMDAVCRLIFRLIIDKSDFAKQELKTFDEDGEQIVIPVGGVDILSNMLRTESDKMGMVESLVSIINSSRSDGKSGGSGSSGK